MTFLLASSRGSSHGGPSGRPLKHVATAAILSAILRFSSFEPPGDDPQVIVDPLERPGLIVGNEKEKQRQVPKSGTDEGTKRQQKREQKSTCFSSVVFFESLGARSVTAAPYRSAYCSAPPGLPRQARRGRGAPRRRAPEVESGLRGRPKRPKTSPWGGARAVFGHGFFGWKGFGLFGGSGWFVG